MEKKALSEVVTTVLLILISIIAVVLLAGFIISMTKKNLNEGTSCFDLRDYMKIVENDYSCYNATATKVVVERGMDNYTISGIILSLMKQGESTRMDVTNLIAIPKPGEAKTYTFNIGYGENVKLGIITKSGKVCEMESYIQKPCLSQ